MNTLAPANFPATIEVSLQPYLNWSWTISVPLLWTCAPKTPDDVVAVCNWAQQAGYQVRARGIMHGWSPLTVTADTQAFAKVLLVDFTKYMNQITFIAAANGQPPQAKAQTGANMDQLLTFLELQPGGSGPAPGYAFAHTPAPGHLTVGGVLAIDAHGTAIPVPGDQLPISYGSLSNQILALTAVVTDPSSPTPNGYAVKTFTRGDAEMTALLTHAGRALIVDATLQLVDNYNLRCQSFTDIPNATLFAQPTGTTPPAQSVGAYLAASGRVEVIWYPFTATSWLKVWTNAPTQPKGSTVVNAPYNYAFSDNLPDWVTVLIKLIAQGAGNLTPKLGEFMIGFTQLSIGLSGVGDIWGPSKNTLLYVKDTTLRVTANGYAIHMKRGDVQRAIYEFTNKFTELLTAYQAKNQYPVNAPLEIRVTALDAPDQVAATNPGRPIISALAQGSDDVANGWDVAVWFDVLTLPGTPASDDFYTQLEAWIYQNYTGSYAKVLPEWSKGWAYSSEGPWTNAAVMGSIREAMTTGREGGDNWDAEVAILSKYDAGGLFTNSLLDALFVQA
ncbi:MAG TPA: cholesterol oxidase substrate-binding domain-containing protein [Gemmatimonadaceae bacterium]|nr:cholesterol oxidase substrate-binding domain-containing protein [Gemmatimonadaceae bacterium]